MNIVLVFHVRSSRHLGRIDPIAVGFDKSYQFFDSHLFGYVLFDTLFTFVQTHFAAPGSYVSVVGIGHLSRPVYNASHDTDF